MIKKIKSSEIKSFIANNSNVELLDVRTQQEWDNVGKPDGEKLGLKTHFITISRGPDGKINKSFLEKIKKNVNKEKKLLIMCQAGGRSLLASQILFQENYECINITDGFEGNADEAGWIKEGLPTK
tara:strand:- start:1588 stop:1965 length:378 start_codon:yes stop_codon:yes gene_type:complete